MAPRAKTGLISSLIAMESGERETRALCQKLVLVNDAKSPLAGKSKVRSEMQTLTFSNAVVKLKVSFQRAKSWIYFIQWLGRAADATCKCKKITKEVSTFNRGA